MTDAQRVARICFEDINKLPVAFAPAIVRLLKKERAAVVRMVKAMVDDKRAEIRCIDDGLCDSSLNRPAEVHAIQREIQVCADLLTALGERGKK